MSTNETPKVEPPPALPDIDATEEKTTEKGAKPVPNAKPRPAPLNPDDTYVYKDYASVPLEALDTDTCHKKVPPACLQAQKLPSKMAVMLVDPGELNVSVGYVILDVTLYSSPALHRLQCVAKYPSNYFHLFHTFTKILCT